MPGPILWLSSVLIAVLVALLMGSYKGECENHHF